MCRATLQCLHDMQLQRLAAEWLGSRSAVHGPCRTSLPSQCHDSERKCEPLLNKSSHIQRPRLTQMAGLFMTGQVCQWNDAGKVHQTHLKIVKRSVPMRFHFLAPAFRFKQLAGPSRGLQDEAFQQAREFSPWLRNFPSCMQPTLNLHQSKQTKEATHMMFCNLIGLPFYRTGCGLHAHTQRVTSRHERRIYRAKGMFTPRRYLLQTNGNC